MATITLKVLSEHSAKNILDISTDKKLLVHRQIWNGNEEVTEAAFSGAYQTYWFNTEAKKEKKIVSERTFLEHLNYLLDFPAQWLALRRIYLIAIC